MKLKYEKGPSTIGNIVLGPFIEYYVFKFILLGYKEINYISP